MLYFATLMHCLLVALDAGTGNKLGVVQINDHPVAVGTMVSVSLDVTTFP